MRIGGTYSHGSAATQGDSGVKADPGATAGSSSATAATGSAVKVTLSAKALELDQAAPEASAKVQRLRAAVESGQLPIDADKIAARIVGD
jgi:flagellar biosynthesis anti-sigma factor FlgM